MKKAIVTGATGTIGIALVNKLLEEEIEVLAIVNPKSNRISRLPSHKRLLILEHSIQELEVLSESEVGRYDAFFHLAWVGTSGLQRDDMSLQLQNVQYTLDAVVLAHRLGCDVFIGAGSQAEYGRVEGKISANTKTNPEVGYGVAKLCAGQMSRIECHKRGIRHVWSRILSVYGPNDGENTMIISSVRKMIRGEQPLFSKGEQLWDYLFCEDAARAMYLIAVKGRDGAIYPIGSGEARPLYEYIDIMCRAVGKKAEVGIGKLPYRVQQVMYLCADITKLTQDTGFLPTITFEQGIHRTIEWCKRTKK